MVEAKSRNMPLLFSFVKNGKFSFYGKKNLKQLDGSSFLGLFGKSNARLIVILMHRSRYAYFCV